ncbi:hypothetical protein FOA52_004229 [Chlamydomonas sp. UWO 241]|nr:hypothetical protein FOA52_004229 [Chlamydomonas sp. UWO 241]
MASNGAAEAVTDAQPVGFADGSAFASDASGPKESRRNSLAALKDIVSGRKDWWEKKASKTGAGSARSSVALPNAAGVARKSGGLLFSLPSADEGGSSGGGADVEQASLDQAPAFAVSQSMPVFRPSALAIPEHASAAAAAPPMPERSPSIGSAKGKGIKRLISKLTKRGSMTPTSAGASPAAGLPPRHSTDAASPVPQPFGLLASPEPAISPNVAVADDDNASQQSEVQAQVLAFDLSAADAVEAEKAAAAATAAAADAAEAQAAALRATAEAAASEKAAADLAAAAAAAAAESERLSAEQAAAEAAAVEAAGLAEAAAAKVAAAETEAERVAAEAQAAAEKAAAEAAASEQAAAALAEAEVAAAAEPARVAAKQAAAESAAAEAAALAEAEVAAAAECERVAAEQAAAESAAAEAGALAATAADSDRVAAEQAAAESAAAEAAALAEAAAAAAVADSDRVAAEQAAAESAAAEAGALAEAAAAAATTESDRVAAEQAAAESAAAEAVALAAAAAESERGVAEQAAAESAAAEAGALAEAEAVAAAAAAAETERVVAEQAAAVAAAAAAAAEVERLAAETAAADAAAAASEAEAATAAMAVREAQAAAAVALTSSGASQEQQQPEEAWPSPSPMSMSPMMVDDCPATVDVTQAAGDGYSPLAAAYGDGGGYQYQGQEGHRGCLSPVRALDMTAEAADPAADAAAGVEAVAYQYHGGGDADMMDVEEEEEAPPPPPPLAGASQPQPQPQEAAVSPAADAQAPPGPEPTAPAAAGDAALSKPAEEVPAPVDNTAAWAAIADQGADTPVNVAAVAAAAEVAAAAAAALPPAATPTAAVAMDVDMDMEDAATVPPPPPPLADDAQSAPLPPPSEEAPMAAAAPEDTVAPPAPLAADAATAAAPPSAWQPGAEGGGDDGGGADTASLAALEAWMNGDGQQSVSQSMDAPFCFGGSGGGAALSASDLPADMQVQAGLEEQAALWEQQQQLQQHQLPGSPALFAPTRAAAEPRRAPLSTGLLDLNASIDLNSGFSFEQALSGEVPPLESTPSPVSRDKASRPMDLRDSIPLFTDRQSFAVDGSVALERLSLDDIAPFAKRKVQQAPALDTLVEVTEALSSATPPPSARAPGVYGHGPHAGFAAHPPHTPLPMDMSPMAATPAAKAAITVAAAAATLRSHAAAPKTAGRGAPPSSLKGPPAATPASAVRGGARRATSERDDAPLSSLKASGAAGAPPSHSQSASANLRGPAAPRGGPGSVRKLAPPTGGGGVTPNVNLRGKGHYGAVTGTPSPAATAPAPAGSPPAQAQGYHSPAAAMLAHAAAATPAPAAPAAAQHQQPISLEPASWATPLARMAAMPVGAAAQLPLMDSSPFGLEDWPDNGMGDISEEARKLFSSLADDGRAASLGMGIQVNHRTPVGYSAAGAPGVAAGRSAPMPSPNTVQVLEMQLGMMVSKLAEAESRQARVDRENEGLRDQLATVQFQCGMPTEGADDMERQARQCAEEQLALATQRLAAADEALIARWVQPTTQRLMTDITACVTPVMMYETCVGASARHLNSVPGWNWLASW